MIPEEIVEATWREVGKYSPDKAVNEMIALGKRQPDLLTFITEFTKDLTREVKELSIYMFFTIYRMNSLTDYYNFTSIIPCLNPFSENLL